MDGISGNNEQNIDSSGYAQNSVNQNTLNNNVQNNQETPEYKAEKFQKLKEKEFQKKQRIENIKAFLQLKTKINQLISLHKIDEAKQTYHSLYKIYQQLLTVVSDTQKKQFEDSLSNIYSKLNDAINNKRVKKGNINQEENIKKPKDRVIRKAALTTDIDMVLQIIDEKGKITLSEIESQFNISRRIAEEWIQILSDANLVNIKYLPVGGIEVTKIN